tara:strand:+ start:887 stop:1093 length:207 start_codon:yes stop_codon:yes gene_type:complete
MNSTEFITLGIIGIILIIGFVLGFLTSLIIIIRENKTLRDEVDKFRDLYFQEMDKWKNKYDNNDYEAY